MTLFSRLIVDAKDRVAHLLGGGEPKPEQFYAEEFRTAILDGSPESIARAIERAAGAAAAAQPGRAALRRGALQAANDALEAPSPAIAAVFALAIAELRTPQSIDLASEILCRSLLGLRRMAIKGARVPGSLDNLPQALPDESATARFELLADALPALGKAWERIFPAPQSECDQREDGLDEAASAHALAMAIHCQLPDRAQVRLADPAALDARLAQALGACPARFRLMLGAQAALCPQFEPDNRVIEMSGAFAPARVLAAGAPGRSCRTRARSGP